MANSLDIQIAEEGPRNAVVKLTGVLDTSNISETPAIALADFQNNDPANLVLVGLRMDMLEYSIGQGLEVQLAWNSGTPQQIFPLAGRGRIFAWSYGGFIPDQTLTGYDGSINLYTTGYVPNTVQNFTIVMELIKLYRF